MDTDEIVLLSICSLLLSILLCFSGIYCSEKIKEMLRNRNLKVINHRLKLRHKNIIKPITHDEENVNEEIKDEREDTIRNVESTNN